ncbi:sigma 54-interacting transcriptional regulator [Pseudomonas sp. MWU12-2319]|uniref:sigma-54 interaction domain-containing protein n=1 Tax=unclassified Pseudomonas TaxID=196821 RepID=UPI00200DBD1B
MSSLDSLQAESAPTTESLLEQITLLAAAQDSAGLFDNLVTVAAQLSGCELSQLYLLDTTQTCLTLSAMQCDGQLQLPNSASQPANFYNEPLLEFCLREHRTLNIDTLHSGLYPTDFLPASEPSWSSLLCTPLVDEHATLGGLLLIGSRTARDLGVCTGSLTQLGRFALAQADLLHRLQGTGNPLKRSPPLPTPSYGLIGNSPPMLAVYRLISKVLMSQVSVLITGETGTGKELVARAIHESGSRSTRRFVVQNCAALPENLLESELFGYQKGAFTGADRNHKGLFDVANGGTLFLDEIGDMQLSLQGKLLRVLQEGEVRPIGSSDTHRVDVRIIAATHHDLQKLVEAGRFRKDLFYRLASFPIELPPLRDRGTDIRLLAQHFCDDTCRSLNRPPLAWSEAALEQLERYGFPGNIRELIGLVERAVLICEDTELHPRHFTLAENTERPKPGPMNLRQYLNDVERHVLLESLRRNAGNQSQTAKELELSRRTLINRLDRLGIAPDEFRSKTAQRSLG